MIEKISQITGLDIIELKELDGYDNINYLITAKSTNYIFKTYNYSTELFDSLEAENAILAKLNELKNTRYPKALALRDGKLLNVHTINGKKLICRLLSFISGDFLGDVDHTDTLLKSFGHFLAKMNLEMKSIKSYCIEAKQFEWDINQLSLNKNYITDISDQNIQNIVNYFFIQYEQIVRPNLPLLRKSIIHNDANEWNVLTDKGKVSAIIDFGDICHSSLINDLAVAITYAAYDKENPLDIAVVILKAYHETNPLEKIEVDLLYYLIAARLCISVCNSAHGKKTMPKNNYARSSEKYAFAMLHKWIAINPLLAKRRFREAIGLKADEMPSTESVLDKRNEHISKILSLSYTNPIYMKGAAFQYMHDAYGNTFLDAYNNIPHVGHSHPKVLDAGIKQLTKLNTNTRYLYDELAAYADKLLSKFPSKLNKVFFVNSGSAASDLAIRLAQAHTKKQGIMVMEHGYHGHTQIAIDVSDYKFSNKNGQGKKDYILKTPIPDCYHGKYTKNDGSAGLAYATDAIQNLKNSGKSLAAFISEPIVGCGGQVPLAKGYLKALYPVIRKQGGICISDEVQTGFGRLGEHFWGFEAQDVIPDMVIIGKPMANGHPMGAVVCTDEIAESFSQGVEFFSSFGGNPVSCSIAHSVLETIEEEALQENARKVGNYYKDLFLNLQKKFTCIGDVRGSGLFLGVEITQENSKEPNTELAHKIKNELREKFILISTDGPNNNVLKTKPPLCFTKENADTVVATIELILKQL